VVLCAADIIAHSFFVYPVRCWLFADDCCDSDVANLIQEMEVMKIIGRHRNVLGLLGCCTQDGTNDCMTAASLFHAIGLSAESLACWTQALS